MRCARVLGLGLLLGMWAGCDREEASGDEVPRVEVPAEDSGSAHSPSVPDVATAPPVGAWVRVRQEHLTSDGETRIAIAYEDAYRIAEVIAVEGKLVKLRTIVAKPEDLCGTSSGVDPDFEIHFFVQLDELRPVLREPKLVEFDDGTKLAFAAGVPVDLSEPEPSLQLGSAYFIVPLTKQEIGWWFPAASAQPPAALSSWRGLSKPLHYGERSVEPYDLPFGDFLDSRTIDGNTLLTFADACGEFTLRVEGDVPKSKRGLYEMKGPRDAVPEMARNIDPEAARRAALLGIPASEAESWGLVCGPTFEAPAGVALTWQDSGSIAGVTRAKVQLPRSAQESAGKLCFTTGSMAVCIASDLLTRTESRECPSFGEGQTLESLFGDGRAPGEQGYGVDIQGADVRQLQPEVSAGLDSDIVRRIVRAHIKELRTCYGKSMTKQPKLAGRITIAFEIGTNGKVSSASVHEVALEPADEALPKCFVQAFKRWTFPKPRGTDPVRVTYPLELASK
jgi:hypothetical protein